MKEGVGVVGCFFTTIIINLLLGGWSVIYLVENLLHKTISWPWAILIGLFGGETTIPAAIIVWILKMAGVL